jgi:hypothetical protein
MFYSLQYTVFYSHFVETVFRSGVEYVYRYESQVLSGIRTVGNQVSGIKIHALVKVQFTRSDDVTLKVCKCIPPFAD